MKQTYYIVQTWSDMFLMRSGDRFVNTYDRDHAAHLSFSEARRLYRQHKGYAAVTNTIPPRRFPRIIKVTIETKTIQEVK